MEGRETAKIWNRVHRVKRYRTKTRKKCGSTRKEVPRDAVVCERERKAEKTEER